MNAEEVKKEVIICKANANFKYYATGNLYYTIQLSSGMYQFPIPIVEEGPTFNDDESGLSMYEVNTIVLSSDLGTTPFNAEIKGSYLNRWIGKAIATDQFIKIG